MADIRPTPSKQRPFLNYYGPVFILYELSSPALNMHWFMDKLQLTGSIYQLINGIILITTFFSCRLVWGTINSVYVFNDIWHAMQDPHSLPGRMSIPKDNSLFTEDVMRFAGDRELPLWLALSYLASNIVLNVLNFYWFAKMIETLRKRFDPPSGTKGTRKDDEREKIVDPYVEIQKGVYGDGRKTLEVHGQEGVRTRRRG